MTSVFKSRNSNEVGAGTEDGFRPIIFTNMFMVLLLGDQPAEITEFKVRVCDICSDGGPLAVSISYFNAFGSYKQVLFF